MTWRLRHWLLLVLASAVVAAYLGVLGPVQDVVDQATLDIKERTERRLAAFKSTIQPKMARFQSRMEQLAHQPRVDQVFADPSQAHGQALIVLGLFLLLTPIAAIMAFTVLMFLLAAIANVTGSWIGSPRVAMFVVATGCAGVTYAGRDHWLPHLSYVAGIVIRAYLLATHPGSI